MAAPSVSFDGIRVSEAESESDGGVWDQWDSSKSPAQEPDFVYQFGINSAAISNKVGTSEAGVEFEATTAYDFAGGGAGGADRVVLFKTIATNYAALNVQGATGMVHYIGSGTTTDRYNYYTYGSDNYPVAGGWVFPLIDPNIAAYRDATDGTPNLNAVNYYAVSATFVATSKAENVAVDAVDIFDVGTGHTLVGGDGVSADATFDDFVSFDEGTASNRYGIVRTLEGILYVAGFLSIGTSATETDFTDETGGTLVFPDGLFGPGTVGISWNIENASSVHVTSNWSFVGRGSITDADSRPDYDVTGAGTNATATFNGCAWRNFRNWTLNAKATYNNCIFADGLLITHNGAVMEGCSFSGSTSGDGVAYLTTADPDNISNSEFVFSDGHAIVITATGSHNIDALTFTGYGADATNDAAIYNNSGGAVTLEVINGSVGVTVRNGTGASTTVNNSVTIVTNGIAEGTAIKYIANETVGTITAGDVLREAIAGPAGDTWTLNYEGAFDPSGLDVLVRARNQGLACAAVADDGGTQTDETANANSPSTNDMTLTPSVPVVNDAYYFGHNEEFAQLKVWVTTAGANQTITWEYWNGAWVALSGVVDGTSSFTTTGDNIVSWTAPSDWADTTVNSQGPYKYVRARVSAIGGSPTGALGRQCQLDVTRYLPIPPTGVLERTITSSGLTATLSQAVDSISRPFG